MPLSGSEEYSDSCIERCNDTATQVGAVRIGEDFGVRYSQDLEPVSESDTESESENWG
jgi:hypothetical protein